MAVPMVLRETMTFIPMILNVSVVNNAVKSLWDVSKEESKHRNLGFCNKALSSSVDTYVF